MSEKASLANAALAVSIFVERWILEQEVPFLVDDVIAAVGDAGLGREGLGRRLAAYPQVARVGGRFHTPRILAKRASFVVRLLEEEWSEAFLFPGHRFLPFQPFNRSATELKLRVEGAGDLERVDDFVPGKIARTCTALLDPDPAMEDLEADEQVELPSFDLGCLALKWRVPAELEVHSVDFEKGVYDVRAHPPAPTKRWREMQSILGGGLVDILKSPPPGPVTAARQLLHVVAAALDKGLAPPIGPLGPLLTQDPRVAVGLVAGRTAFVLAGATRAPAPERPDSSTLSVLDAHLFKLQQGIKAYEPWRTHVYETRWDPDTYRFTAIVYSNSDSSRDAFLDFSGMPGAFQFGCSCEQLRAKRTCRHVVALLHEAISLLRNPRGVIAQAFAHDLSRPAWVGTLERIDVLARVACASTEKTQRIAWRLEHADNVLCLKAYVQKLQASGGWTRGRQIDPDRLLSDTSLGATEADLRAARTIAWTRSHGSWRRRAQQDSFEALLHLVGHPLVSWEGEGIDAISIEKAAPSLSVRPREAGGHAIVLRAGGLVQQEGIECIAGDGGVVFADRAAGRVVLAPARPDLVELLHLVVARKPSFPPEAKDELLARLPALEAAMPVDLPADLAGEEVPSDTKMRLRLSPGAPAGLTAALRVKPLAGGPLLVPGEPPERVSDSTQGKRVCVRRRLEEETERAQGVAGALSLDDHPELSPWTWLIASDDDALDLIARLQDASWPDLVVEWDEAARKMLLTREATPKDLRVAVQDAADWFGIEGQIEIDGTVVPLAHLIEAIRDGRRYVAVTGGMWVRISKLFQDRLREMSDILQLDHGKLTVGPAAAPLLRDVVRETGLTKACRAWEAFLERFDRAMLFEPDPPKGFTATFRPYQLEGYRWLARLATWGVGGVLADDMGLGKTVEALALLVDRAKEGPALVVAPTSVASNWVAETRRFAPGLRPVLYRDTDRDGGGFGKGDLVVISYAMVLRDVERIEKGKWGTLLLDEAQFVKNSQTKTAQAIRRIPAGWRVALTGTPIENHLGDLWSLFRAISPGLFGSWERFRTRFAAPIERDKDPKRREALARMVRPFILRRTKDEVLRELPARTEVQLDAELSAEERKLYDQARLLALANLAKGGKGEDPRFQVLAALTRLRQLACHPRLVLPDTKAGSAKLGLFLETVEELREEGHRALVFSQFTSLLAIVREALDTMGVTYQYLDGSTPAAKRDQAVAAFQGGEGDLFLISLKAGGTGLNLTGADYVIHLDPWWNPAVEDQATNRAHRIGQTRPVTVYRIVAKGTIEEKILSLHAAKRDLVEGVLDGTDQAAKLNTEELIALIREG